VRVATVAEPQHDALFGPVEAEGALTTVLGTVVLLPAVGLSVEQPASTATREAVANTAAVWPRTDRKVVVMSSSKSAAQTTGKSLLIDVLIGHPRSPGAAVVSLRWTTGPKCVSS
jgi:hypothetical protein